MAYLIESMIYYLSEGIPIIILLLGTILLVLKKAYNPIFFGVIGLLLLEIISSITLNMGDNKWTLYFSGPLYIVLINTLYNTLYFKIFTKKIFTIIASIIVATMFIGLFFIHQINNSFVFHYIAFIELLVLIYPSFYFLKVVQQKTVYHVKHFAFNGVILLFFSLDILFYVMLKFLFDNGLIDKDVIDPVLIRYVRYFVIQLFYIFLIYSGWKLWKK